MGTKAGTAARTVAVCILAAWTMSAVGAADDKDVVKDIKSKLDAAVADVKDFTIRQECHRTSGGNPAAGDPMTMLSRYKGIKFRIDMDSRGVLPPRKESIIFDGKDTWYVSETLTHKIHPDPETYNVFWWRAIPDDASVAGTEKVSDRECYVFNFTRRNVPGTPGDIPVRMWVDKENLRLLKEVFTTTDYESTDLYSDYKKIHGDWELAHKWERSAPATKYRSLAATKSTNFVEVNGGLPDDLFDTSALKETKP